MTYLHTSANVENSMLTSLVAPVTESKTGGMLQSSLNGKKTSYLEKQTEILFSIFYSCETLMWKTFTGLEPDQITGPVTLTILNSTVNSSKQF